MIYFLGNCQIADLRRSKLLGAEDSGLRWLATPETYIRSNLCVPSDLEAQIEKYERAGFLNSRGLVNQFNLVAASEPKPRLLIFNLFHEEEPLFVSRQDGHAFYIATGALESSPDFARWVKANYAPKALDPKLWLDRFLKMIRRVRLEFPAAPIVLVQRLSHLPFYGPSPYSYLRGWESNWRKAKTAFEELSGQVGNCHVIDIDRVMAGYLRANNLSFDRVAPYLMLKPERRRYKVLRKLGLKKKIVVQRDLEHLKPDVWDSIAQKISRLREEGKISYAREESVPDEWYNIPARANQPVKEIETLLESGDLLDCACAIGRLINKLPENHTDMLLAYRRQIPAGKYLLRMVKIYAKFQPDPRLIEWCSAHRKRAFLDFADADEGFVSRYLSEIDKIEQLSTV